MNLPTTGPARSVLSLALIAVIAAAGALAVPTAAAAASVAAAPAADAAAPDAVVVFREGGADRYETAVRNSQSAFGIFLPVLYIVSGENFPDALSAGPAAVREGGGMLLVRRDDIPDVTRTEIGRLSPQKIVVVGGPATISDSVVAELTHLQPNTVRIGGSDRYEVSRRVVQYAFCGDLPGAGAADPLPAAAPPEPCDRGTDQVFVATGDNYPDALAAGPAAGHLDAPVLLVPGSASGLDDATKATLSRIGADSAYIAGGPASVSEGVQSSLASVVPGAVERLAGADRYSGAVAINRAIFPAQGTSVYYASGELFADALAGGPAATAYQSPMYLVHQNCIPAETAAAVDAFAPSDITLLGGPNTLGPGVESLTAIC